METQNLNSDKYRLVCALRPFSYSVALITCGLGVALAFSHGNGNTIKSFLVILAGVLLQAASNLANDYADIQLWRNYPEPEAQPVIRQIKRNFLLAGCCTLIACLIGIWLVIDVGWPLLVLGIFGVLGGYSYTGEPIYYKQRGLGVPAVFLFTGVLMVSGSYYAVTGYWSNLVIWISLPVSLLASALLMANEIRDFLDDGQHGIRTFTVRIGSERAKLIYALLLLSVYPISFYLFWQGKVHNALYLLPSLIFIWRPLELVFHKTEGSQLVRLPPLTGRFFLIFGAGFIASVL